MIRFGWLERELTDVSGTNREALTNKPNNETNTQTTSSSNSKRTGCFGSWEMRGRGGEIDVKKKLGKQRTTAAATKKNLDFLL